VFAARLLYSALYVAQKVVVEYMVGSVRRIMLLIEYL
jgi:hypothetical protein